MKFANTSALDFNCVYIIPQYTEIASRSEVDTSTIIDHREQLPPWEGPLVKIDVPVLSANMDTVTDGKMASAMWKAGGMGVIHRFLTVEENLKEWEHVVREEANAFVSVGVTGDSLERAKELYKAGARYFVIDIAHGHSQLMRDMIRKLRNIGHVYIMAGNVATDHAVGDLNHWGADAVKIGIGPGAVCVTKNVTGVTVPQFSAIAECCANKYTTLRNRPLVRVADGGIREIGDIAKALGAGADAVMCGRMFASCKETPGPRMNGQKIYRGMASRDAMLTIRDEANLPTPEGISTLIQESEESAADVVRHIKGGLQSAFSYSNARTLLEFQEKAKFGIRHTAMK